MFCPPPDHEESQNVTKTHPRRRRKKKFTNKKPFKNQNSRKKSKFDVTMSSWAENFTIAATWQLKHQLAHWKARAKALEYENKVLHDIIRKNHYDTSLSVPVDVSTKFESEDTVNSTPDYHEHDTEMDEQEQDFEVSEEFIEFLRANAKYKEDARLERERLKAKYSEDNTIEQLEAAPVQPEDPQEKLIELYGSDWQRIAALEMSVQTNFMNESDQEKPMYWPNIPFNFNFS